MTTQRAGKHTRALSLRERIARRLSERQAHAYWRGSDLPMPNWPPTDPTHESGCPCWDCTDARADAR